MAGPQTGGQQQFGQAPMGGGMQFRSQIPQRGPDGSYNYNHNPSLAAPPTPQQATPPAPPAPQKVMSAQQPPNVFQQASGALTGAIGGTNREMGYQPGMVGQYGYGASQAGSRGYNVALGQSTGYGAAQTGSTGYNAATGQATGYDASQAGATGYGAATLSGSPTVQAQNVQAGQLGSTNLNPYFNPFESQVVNQSLQDIERSRQIQQNQTAAQAEAAGAYGGSRSGVLEAETNRGFADQAARTASQLRQAGFTNAQQMAQQDIATRMQASLANQGANLQAGTTTANLAQQAGLANQSALNQAGQFGAQAQNVAALQNMAAQNQAAQFGAGAQNTMTAQNLAAMNQAGQFGAQAQNVASLQNMAAQNQASQFGAQAANTMTGQNLAALNQAGQFGAGASNTAALQNMAARNQAGQFNASQAMQAALANQQAGLQGSQQRLSAAGQLGTLGNLGFGMGQQIQSGMNQQGALQQAMMQRIIDAARQQYTGYQQQPATALGYLGSALGVAPVPQTTTTSRQPGLFDYLTLGASMF